jgi:hypothetical protein
VEGVETTWCLCVLFFQKRIRGIQEHDVQKTSKKFYSSSGDGGLKEKEKVW